MRAFSVVMAGAGLALAACGSGTEESDAAAPDVTAEIDKAFKPEPGQYTVSMETDGMMGMTGPMKQTFDYCLTEEQAAGGFEEALNKNENGDCKYEKFTLDGDQVDAVLACTTQGVTMRMEQKGTATPTSSDLAVTMTMNLPGMGERTTQARVRHQRTGDCPAG